MAVCHVPCPNALCVCVYMFVGSVCVCVLHTDPICLVAGHSLGKCVQAKNSHTAQRSNYEPPLREGEGGGRGDNRGLSISEGGMMVSLPLTSPFSLLPAPPQTNMCQQELSMEEIPSEENRPAI